MVRPRIQALRGTSMGNISISGLQYWIGLAITSFLVREVVCHLYRRGNNSNSNLMHQVYFPLNPTH